MQGEEHPASPARSSGRETGREPPRNLLSPRGLGRPKPVNRRLVYLQEKSSDHRCSADRRAPFPGARRILLRKRKTCFCRSFMELAGLEPATSWVRSTCSSERELACLQRVSGEHLECRNISRNIPASDLQRDQCLRRQRPSASETTAIDPEAPYVAARR